jgi:hypothetical protein
MIYYIAGYKYQLHKDYSLAIPALARAAPSFMDYGVLTRSGTLKIDKGYAWNGANNPAIDTQTIMRGSLVHDALYQLMDSGELALKYKTIADDTFIRICKRDGMSALRAWWVHRAVKRFGRPAVNENKIKIRTSP